MYNIYAYVVNTQGLSVILYDADIDNYFRYPKNLVLFIQTQIALVASVNIKVLVL
jgi:hypothetical protein